MTARVADLPRSILALAASLAFTAILVAASAPHVVIA